MTTCPACSIEIPHGTERCPSCGTGLDVSSLATETGLSSDAAPDRVPAIGSQSGPSAVGITSEIQGGAGEYQPGAVVAGRYRIVGLLGRGGMGSVYRADDLTLGQPVALKFLPEALAANRERLDRFRAEVRVSRQVSHANVCRVHDIGEADGRVFLSMELVDGGDLSSLLKRVGRLPADRGLEIARQLCAGLAAAHDRGVLHRDLKPANVMIDSEGRVRIADFGLAGIVGGFEGSEIQSGTPAYMAPETLKGEEVTVQSDVYALGLVLYELFTGRRAFSGASVAELAHKHAEEPPTTPSDIVSDLDPQIEGVILQCLEKDPRARPKSALAVAMALPGGDPLAAALAAGETPSPELVAQAGDEGTLKLSTGWWLLASIAGMLVAFIALSAGRHVLFFERLERPPEVQLDRGVETLERLGVEVPRTDRKTGFAVDRVLQREINRNGLTDDEREALISGETSIVRFWVRAAPLDLVAERTSGRVGPTWPPRTTPGELYAVFDSLGRLRLLEVVPEELMTTADGESPGTVADPWAGAFEAAGLDPMVFDEAQPSWSPPRHVDELRGWMRVGDAPGLGVNRVEVGLCAGRVAYLRTGTAFDHAQESSGTTTGSMLAQTLNAALIVIVLIVGGLLARGNLRRGRGDLRGSWRMAGAVFMLGMTAWLVSADHAFGAGDELDLFVLATGDSLFMAGFVWLLYLALEPEVRRHWPKRLISWQRMLSRSSHDPLVGRHVLIGLVLGSWISLLIVLISSVGKIANPEGFDLDSSGIVLLADPWVVVASVLSNLSQAIFGGVFVTVLLLAVRLLVRRTWISVAVSIVIFVAMNVLGSDDPVVDGVVSALVLAVVMVALLRHGLLTLIAMVFVLNLLQAAPPITSLSSWYLPAGLIPLLVVLVLAVVAFSVSIGRQPWFGAD